MYRPEFAYATPPGCRDEDFVYFFDGSNVPQLAPGIMAGTMLSYVPLTLDRDAPFYWRGWKVQLRNVTSSGCPPVALISYMHPDVNIQLRDCYDNNLSDGLIPATQGGFPSNPVSFFGQELTGPPTVLEAEIYCPPGGVIQMFLQGGASLSGRLENFFSISLFGVKRFKECK